MCPSGCLCARLHRAVYIRGCHCSFALTCAVFTFFFSLLHTPGCDCQLGTSSMNVDIVRFVVPPKVFSHVPASPPPHRLPDNGLVGEFPRWLHWQVQMTTVNNLVKNWFWLVLTETKPARTISIISGGLKSVTAEIWLIGICKRDWRESCQVNSV